MPNHIVTFGERYKREPHPVLGDHPELPNGYGLVRARDYRRARAAVEALFGIRFCSVYIDTPDNRAWYPLGRLFTIDATTDTPTITWTQENAS